MANDQPHANGRSIGALPRRGVDPAGRLLPITDEERRARLPLELAALDEIADIPADETDRDEIWDEVFRNLGVDPLTGGGLEP